jgi:hypothetical protein
MYNGLSKKLLLQPFTGKAKFLAAIHPLDAPCSQLPVVPRCIQVEISSTIEEILHQYSRKNSEYQLLKILVTCLQGLGHIFNASIEERSGRYG